MEGVVKRKNKLRHERTVTEKVALLDRYKVLAPEVSQRKAAEIFGVTRSFLNNTINKESVIRAQNEDFGNMKRLRAGKDELVEKELLDWFKETTFGPAAVQIPSTKTLMKKAQQIARDTGHEDFQATDGWMGRWKKRSGLKNCDRAATLLKLEKQVVDVPGLFPNYDDENVYVADETAIFFRVLPNNSTYGKHMNQEGFPTATERFTLLVACSMSGEKEELLVVGNTPTNNSPLPYTSSPNALMTKAIFERWIIAWDIRLQREGDRKIALLLDDCWVHHCDVDLQNISITYLPPGKPVFLMLTSFGIFRALKAHFRCRLLKKLIAVVHDTCDVLNVKISFSIAIQQVTLLEAIQMIKESWSKLAKASVQNCWRVAKFSLLPLITSVSARLPAAEELPHDVFEEWIAMDTGVDVVENPTSNCDDEEQIEVAAPPHHHTMEEESPVSAHEMLDCLCRLESGLSQTAFKDLGMFQEMKASIEDHIRGSIPPTIGQFCEWQT